MDAGPGAQIDVGFFGMDADVPADTGAADASTDATVPQDSGVAPDSGEAADTGAGPDAEPVDAADDAGPTVDGAVDAAVDGGGPDAATDGGAPDAAVDAGPVFTDSDGDGIADQHEGNGLVDTDGDGIPDSQDPDSDNDGIPDSVEAGDLDLATPPVDSDFDGIPDFRDLDSDGDLISDLVETSSDADADMIPNYLDADSDGDTISDRHEGAGDADGDLIANFLDDDSDGDGLSDALEAGDALISSPPRDSDFDGLPNFLDLDSDNDFIRDVDEGSADSDSDGILDYIDIDSDNDSILDRFEAGDQDLLTPPLDTNNDGTPDYRDTDSDGDTITDLHEGRLDTDGNGVEDRISTDSDGDGWTDAIEAGDADPLTPPVDTDGDGTPDYRDLDSDGDGLSDQVELGCPAGSNRAQADSDGDTFDDLAETAYGSDPCDALDIIDDFYFVLPPNGPGANAPLTFTDTQIDRADLAINIDTTGSMSGEIANLQSSLSSQIIPGVGAAIPDAAFAVSSFEDYPILPFGQPTANDIPFRLGTRVTTNAAAAQSAVNALVTRNGFDFPESGLEALFQVTSGSGTTWPGGSVPAFNPAVNNIPGVADGTIGGVGFRPDSLPLILHITDAASHRGRDYAGQGTTAAPLASVRASLAGVGARVVTISNGVLQPYNDLLCAGVVSTWWGGINPLGDVDWYVLQGAVAGDTVSVDVTGRTQSGSLDSMVAVANSTAIIAQNDDISATNLNAALTNVTLTGTGPFYIAVTSTGDNNFDGAGGTETGFYLINVSVNGSVWFPSPTVCRADDPNSRTGATAIVDGTTAQAPANQAQCQADCDAFVGILHPLFADFTFPYEIAEDTGAVIPPCAWSFFGASRPTGCAANQCCTGINGAGTAPNAGGNCPLAFEIQDNGAGIGAAAVAGVQALVNFAAFTITTVVRPDPAELSASGLDTTCFIHGVVPQTATPPNTCAPNPVAVDLVPPTGLDSWQNVVPGTVLDFQVNALNQQNGTMNACVASTNAPQQFTAFIDVVADGVTVVDTRRVIIIVPPATVGGGN